MATCDHCGEETAPRTYTSGELRFCSIDCVLKHAHDQTTLP